MLALGIALLPPAAASAAPATTTPADVIRGWYRLVLDLVRHTPTYSPPVASRAFGYLGVTAYEATASGDQRLRSLAGQLNGLAPVPTRDPANLYDDRLVLHAALGEAAAQLFNNTGPTGQRALAAFTRKRGEAIAATLPADVADRSTRFGKAVAAHVLAWAAGDGGAVIENMGFPLDYSLGEGPARWVPTSTLQLQQKPLLPRWGSNRPFAMPAGNACPLPPPPDYSEHPGSAFRMEAEEVVAVTGTLSDEQKRIARFWSDDPMLSPTPPGHWIAIALDVVAEQGADAARTAEVLALLGVAMGDAFIGCWHSKYQYDLLRPVTYIRRVIDPTWQPLLITPPFPEYPSGHSTQSAAAATVLTALLGSNVAFTDRTHEKDGMPPRQFANFWAAADEAGVSRLYGGIHFRSAVTRGLDQGRCIGAYAAQLKTRP